MDKRAANGTSNHPDLAYEEESFLTSDAARPLRILVKFCFF